MFGVCMHGYMPAVCPVCTAMMNQALEGPMYGFPMTNSSMYGCPMTGGYPMNYGSMSPGSMSGTNLYGCNNMMMPSMAGGGGGVCVHGFPAGMCFFWDCNMCQQFQLSSFNQFCNHKVFSPSSGLNSSNPSERKAAFHTLKQAWSNVPDYAKDQAKDFLQEQAMNVASDAMSWIQGMF
jgi:hypothetical protein